jgi:NAD(P)-dependent dehydrogenase (short-subunit alcohol dehydrogenase family)
MPQPRSEAPVAIVTGAGRGIGAAIAGRLAEAGFRLLLCSRSDSAAAVAREIGGDAVGVSADVAAPDALARVAEAALSRYGRIDALVNNAGVNHGAAIADMRPEQFDEMYAVNVRGAFLGVQAVLPAMIAQGSGRIVNVASFTGRTPVPGFTAYSATKAAVLSLTRGHALELAEHGITVNAVCPGNVWSDIWASATAGLTAGGDVTAERLFDQAVAATPLGRPQTGADVADAAAFLCSDAARNITGEAIFVTGGM